MNRLILVGVVCIVAGFIAGAVSCLLVSDDHGADVSRLTEELKSERVKTAALEHIVGVLRGEREVIQEALKAGLPPLPVSK